MSALHKHINWNAVGVAVVGAYLLPVVLACFATSFAAWLFALWILAPVCAGFLVARLAKIVPLVHGLVVSMVALVIFVLVYDFAKLLTGFVFLIWVILNVACSVFGAWLWRRQSGALA